MEADKVGQHRAFWRTGLAIFINSVGLCLSGSGVEADSSLCPAGRQLVTATRVPDAPCCQVSEYCAVDGTQQNEPFMLFSARHCSLNGKLEGECSTSRQDFLFSTSSKQILVPNPAAPTTNWLTARSADSSIANHKIMLDKLRGDMSLKQKYIFAYEPLLRSGPWIIEIVRTSHQSRQLEAKVFFGGAPGLGGRTSPPPRSITYSAFGKLENCISPKDSLLFAIVKPAYLSGDECILIAQIEIDRECPKLDNLVGYRRQILQQTGACQNPQGASN